MSISDWDQRLLCADGACVGVIGPEGTCNVCGRAAANWGDERRRGLKTTGEVDVRPTRGEVEGDDDEGDGDDDDLDDDEDSDDDDDDPDDDGDEGDADAAPDGIVQAQRAAPESWDQRELCSNGACIGVIGDDGKCKTCGATAA